MAHTACYPEKAPQINVLLDTLSHHFRREIIHYFEIHSNADTALLAEMVDHLQARIPDTSHEDVELKLIHSHLPKLAERDWIEYDSRSQQIRYHGHRSAPDLVEDLHTMFANRKV